MRDVVDPVARAVAVLGGAAPMPIEGGEPVFAEPWEGRAFAMALDVIDRNGLTWEDFRSRLVAAVGVDPARPYYESWVVALERLVVDTEAVSTAELGRARNRAAAYRYDEDGVGDIEVFPVRLDDDDALPGILTDLFDGPWSSQVRRPATLPVLDGCRHAELYRTWLAGAPTSWGFRMFDGDDDVQLDVLLPNPFLDDDDQPLDPPDWSRLACWDHLRRRFWDLAPDPADRLAPRSRHA